MVAVLANAGIIELSTYSTNLLTLLVIAAGTDYAIFLLGRFHEARYAGEDRVAAFTTMYHGTAHIILGSGLTIAGAVMCLTFTRLPYFQSLGIPAGTGVLVAVVAALTLAPALGSASCRHFGLFEPARRLQTQGWRRIGTAIVRWPGPWRPPYYRPDRPDRPAQLQDQLRRPRATCRPARPTSATPPPRNGTSGAAQPGTADDPGRPRPAQFHRHDPVERVAKAVFHTDGIAQVQSITRPLGTPLDHTSIPFQISASSASQINNLPFQQAPWSDSFKQVDVINNSIDVLRQQYALQQQSRSPTSRPQQACTDRGDGQRSA